MAKKKPTRLRGAAKALAQVKAIYMHDFLIGHKVPLEWMKSPTRPSASELDLLGIRVEVEVEDDTYNFGVGLAIGSDSYSCVDVLEQWRIDAIQRMDTGDAKVTAMARTCGVTRQALYKLIDGGRSPQHYFTIRGRSPTLLWQGKPLDGEFERCLPDLESWNLIGSLA